MDRSENMTIKSKNQQQIGKMATMDSNNKLLNYMGFVETKAMRFTSSIET